jgi:hypothetical protein
MTGGDRAVIVWTMRSGATLDDQMQRASPPASSPLSVLSPCGKRGTGRKAGVGALTGRCGRARESSDSVKIVAVATKRCTKTTLSSTPWKPSWNPSRSSTALSPASKAAMPLCGTNSCLPNGHPFAPRSPDCPQVLWSPCLPLTQKPS